MQPAAARPALRRRPGDSGGVRSKLSAREGFQCIELALCVGGAPVPGAFVPVARRGHFGGWGAGTVLLEHRGIVSLRQREGGPRSEEHTSELQSHHDLVCRLLLEKKKKKN